MPVTIVVNLVGALLTTQSHSGVLAWRWLLPVTIVFNLVGALLTAQSHSGVAVVGACDDCL